MLAFVSAHPPGDEDGRPTVNFTKSEIGRVDLRGVPLQVEHGAGRVGEVVSSWQGTDGSLKCLVRTDPSTLDGIVAGRLLAAGHAPEVSLGTEVDIDRERVEVTRKEVKELSLVRRGARKGTVVHAVAPSVRVGDIRALNGGSAPNPKPMENAAPAAAASTSAAAPSSATAPATPAPVAPVNAELLQRLESLENEKKQLEAHKEMVIAEAQKLIQEERARVEAESSKRLQEELAKVQAQAQAEVEAVRKKKTEELMSIYGITGQDFEKILESIFAKTNLPLTQDVRQTCREAFNGPASGLVQYMVAASAAHRSTIEQLNASLAELEALKKERQMNELRETLLRKAGAAPTEERFVTLTANASAAAAAALAPLPAAQAPRDDVRSRLLSALEGSSSTSGMDRLTPEMVSKRRRLETPVQY